MIVYQETKRKFIDHVVDGEIADIIVEYIQKKMHMKVSHSSVRSFQNSLSFMERVLSDDEIPDDAGVAIEYNIPQTSKRIDFILTGQDADRADQAILIELKQWDSAELTEKDGVVKTRFEAGRGETSHPSYQVWSYAALLNGFNETVYTEKINLQPCAYLHNYPEDDVIRNDFYREYIERAPVFLKTDRKKLTEFIKKFVKHGDTSQIMYRIDNGKIRPSKMLADSLAKMLKGNNEFVMIDDQKVVYETAMAFARKSDENNKNVLIVQGGPGTGKSVVAVNLLVNITKTGLKNVRYVTKNAAPRDVFFNKLSGSFKQAEIKNFFSGSGSFMDCDPNIFDALVVDEAHRLNEKSGMFKNLGENQIKEIIAAAKCSIFFLDEDQKVTWSDIGSTEEIQKFATEAGAKVYNMELSSQFRCNGSDGYLAWLDHMLQIRETANPNFGDLEYDFRVVDSPNELRDLIFEKNKINNKARLVAGYCWNWQSKKDALMMDIVIPEHDFGMQWNLATDGNLWIQAPESVNQVGCIHTCQGLEVDYVGVIVGRDLIARDGQVIADPTKRARTDKSLAGFKSAMKVGPIAARAKADAIIKNTYRTLMTRGIKGCYIYFEDEELGRLFKESQILDSLNVK